LKNSKFREYRGGQLYAQILQKMCKDHRKIGIEALLEAGRWLCRWCEEFNAIGEERCHSCQMPREIQEEE